MFFKKKKTIVSLVSPLTGTSVSLSEVPDPAFAEALLGDGVAIKPTNGVLMSPCDGIVAHLIDTHHACIVGHDSGVEVLMHIGVNTVQLKGEGFKPLIKTGDVVKQGQPLIEFDMAFIESKGYPVITPVIMANGEVVEQLTKHTGEVKAGDNTVLDVEVKK